MVTLHTILQQAVSNKDNILPVEVQCIAANCC